MKSLKNLCLALITSVLLLLLIGCASTPVPTETSTPMVDTPQVTTDNTPVETNAPIPTFTPVPLQPTSTPTPTIEPTVPLSVEGPWLVLRGQRYMLEGGRYRSRFDLFDENGPGHITIITINPGDDINPYLLNGDNSDNYLSFISGNPYLIRPLQNIGISLFDNRLSTYSGDANSGLLASTYQASGESAPELLIYNLPSGTVRDRFPLIKCPAQATGCPQNSGLFSDIGMQKIKWSPNGRYLAFAAVMESMSSDLYVYDKVDGSLRRLTSGPDWVGKIEWSPDGRWIIMEEIVMPTIENRKVEDYFYIGAVLPSSLWAVSVSDDEIRKLDTINDVSGGNILAWLDNSKFLFYDGAMMKSSAGPEPGYRLRLLDVASEQVKMLYENEIYWARFYEGMGQVVVQKHDTETEYFLISVKTGNVKSIGESSPSEWDQQLGLYITEDACAEDVKKIQAFDANGKFTCISKPTPTATPEQPKNFPSPNEAWSISISDGVWVEAKNQPAVQVSPEMASDIIWCPDASCFFFPVLQQGSRSSTLYRVSLPDLTVTIAADKVGYTGIYQWLGGK